MLMFKLKSLMRKYGEIIKAHGQVDQRHSWFDLKIYMQMEQLHKEIKKLTLSTT